MTEHTLQSKIDSGNKTENKKRPLRGVRELKTCSVFQVHINSSARNVNEGHEKLMQHWNRTMGHNREIDQLCMKKVL